MGPAFQAPSNVDIQVNHVRVDEDLHLQIQRLWETDFKDISLTPQPTFSKEDRYALRVMDDNVKMVNGRYQAPILWKPGCPDFPDNRSLVMKRTMNLGKRLLKDKDLCEKYCENMTDFKKRKWAKVLEKGELNGPKGKTWYLPHQPVLSEKKQGKVRLVYDCAAKYKGTSLNDQVLKGPDLGNSLLGVLENFRMHEHGIVADVKAMYHQVNIDPGSCDALRFLFWPNDDFTEEPIDHQMLVNLFGSTQSSFVATYCLKKTVTDFGKNFPADIGKIVDKNSYVDDFLLGASSVEDGRRIIRETQELVALGGFHLTKWLSNTSEILSDVPEADKALPEANVSLYPSQIEHVLGVKWYLKDDSFGFDVNLKPKPATKRGILSYLNSISDPMGILAPVSLIARGIFQKLCRKKLAWDDPIGDEESTEWTRWINSVPYLGEIKLRRCLKPASFGKIVSSELHHFGDASNRAYGTVSYLRLKNQRGDAHCSFLVSKARLCPIKTKTSIPRMELTAAALCVKVDMFLRRELDLNVNKSIFWTDSTATLQSIYNTNRRFSVFVSNRLSKIEEGSTPDQWKYVPTELNVADYVSRGMTVKKLKEKKVWLNGPNFLRNSESEWPVSPVNLPDIPQEFLLKEQVAVLVNRVSEEDPTERFINYYSSWYRLKKAVAWIRRYFEYICKRYTIKNGNLNVGELQEAEFAIIRYTQNSALNNIIAILQEDQQTGKIYI